MNHHPHTRWASRKNAATLALIAGVSLLTACAGVKAPPKEYAQEQLDMQIQVPPGHVVALETTAVGLLNYECRPNAATGGFGWMLASSQAELLDRTGKAVVQYSGPPPTWTYMDGSSVTGEALATAPRPGATNLNYQLSKAMPGVVPGVLQSVTYIQRIKTKGGQDLSKACTQTDAGDKLTLPYQADYIFWKPA